MKASEELERLLQPDDSSHCLVALTAMPQAGLSEVPAELLLDGGSQAVMGTLDVVVTRSVAGEALIGKDAEGVYMINVCTAEAARRRGVGHALVAAAVNKAREVGVALGLPVTDVCCLKFVVQTDKLPNHVQNLTQCKRQYRISTWHVGGRTLYVHLMAVNEIGRRLYESCGFELEQEETSNQAHYRGHCLDGIEGRGRTILLRRDI